MPPAPHRAGHHRGQGLDVAVHALAVCNVFQHHLKDTYTQIVHISACVDQQSLTDTTAMEAAPVISSV